MHACVESSSIVQVSAKVSQASDREISVHINRKRPN